jgi:hypothetical protein
MNKPIRLLVIGLTALAVCALFACQKAKEEHAAVGENAATAEMSEAEIQASVPELGALHEVIYPLWHSAYPEKDYALIKELLPKADTLVAALDAAVLPGILREKQQEWTEMKANLKETLAKLHTAADANDEAGMLAQTEAFHAGYEQLVRAIRPVVPALESFHQEMYKLYHYYAPAYDLAKIREAAAAMQAKIEPLKGAELPKRLADRRADYDAAVQELEAAVVEFAGKVKTDSKEEILAAVEKVHAAYQKAEKVFD